MPTFHCHCAGMSASYSNTISVGTGCGLKPCPSVDNCPFRRFAAVATGGLPGVENTVFPSGRS